MIGGFLEDVWRDYPFLAVATGLLLLFFAFRMATLLFRYRRLKREGVRGQIVLQTIVSGALTVAGVVACFPEIAGLRREELYMKPRDPRPDGAAIASSTSTSWTRPTPRPTATKRPGPSLPAGISWEGGLGKARAAIEKRDWAALARALHETWTKEPSRRKDVQKLLLAYPVGHDLNVLGHEALEQGDRKRALELFDFGTDLAPDESDGFYGRAIARLGGDAPDWIGALADLGVAARKAPRGDTRALEKRLEIRLGKNLPDPKGALEDLDAIIAVRPDAGFFATRGRLRGARGQVEGAIADLSSASRAFPGDVGLRLDLIDLRLRLGDAPSAEVALKELEPLLRSPPRDREARALSLRGIARYRLRRYDEALADLKRAVELDPALLDAHYFRGRARLDSGDFLYARGDFDQVLKLDPGHRGAYFYRGLALRDRDPRRALEDLQRAIELAPDPWAYYYRGDLLWKVGRKEEGDRCFNEALSACGQDDALRRQIDELIRRARPSSKPPR